MRLIVCENYDEMSKAAANIIAAQVTLKPKSILGLATGSTPIGMYNNLASMYSKGELDFSEVISFNLDEYYPLKKSNEQSYDYFMKDNLFSKINIKPENIHIPNGEAQNAEEECKNYDKMIAEKGGIDLQVLGIGNNGHIGFNEPGATLESGTNVTDLTEDTIQVNSRFFNSIDEVPKRAITMGMYPILSAKTILLLISGKSKNAALKRILTGKITTDCPASFLNIHSDAIVIVDKDAMNG